MQHLATVLEPASAFRATKVWVLQNPPLEKCYAIRDVHHDSRVSARWAGFERACKLVQAMRCFRGQVPYMCTMVWQWEAVTRKTDQLFYNLMRHSYKHCACIRWSGTCIHVALCCFFSMRCRPARSLSTSPPPAWHTLAHSVDSTERYHSSDTEGASEQMYSPPRMSNTASMPLAVLCGVMPMAVLLPLPAATFPPVAVCSCLGPVRRTQSISHPTAL